MALGWVLHSFVGVGPRVHHSFPRGLGEHHMSPLEELGVRHTNLLQELLGIHMNLVRVPHIPPPVLTHSVVQRTGIGNSQLGFRRFYSAKTYLSKG